MSVAQGLRLLGVALAAMPAVVLAQTAPPTQTAPGAEFSFRRIAPPAPGAQGPRITIQIDPEAQAARLAAPPPVVPPESERADPVPETGFWAAVSPSLQDASSARLSAALAAVDGAPAPRLDDVKRIADRYGRDILRHTVGTHVSPALVAAIISVESSGRAEAVSGAGAAGLMQLMPATAARFGVDDRNDPAENIRGGVAYLDWLMGEFGRDPVLILAGYNAGENAVWNHGGVPPYAETRAYVPKVLAAFRVAAGLCLTRPELISDGCVFAGTES